MLAVHSIITIMNDLEALCIVIQVAATTTKLITDVLSVSAYLQLHVIVGITSQQHLQGLGSARQPPIRP